MLVIEMDGKVIIIGLVIIAIIILGILAIVYYVKSKKDVTTSSIQEDKPVSQKIDKPVSISSFEEIQDDETPFPPPQDDEVQDDEVQDDEVQEEDREVHSQEEEIPVLAEEQTSFQPQSYNTSTYQEHKKNTYANFGVNYSEDTDLNFQFSRRDQSENSES